MFVRVRVRVMVMVSVTCFVVIGGHKEVLCVRVSVRSSEG